MVMLELAASERSRPLPPPTFSAPFSSPTLQWPRKKRQRCPNPLLDHHLSTTRRRIASPSPDPPPSSSSPTSAAADNRHRASPSPSPAPASSERPRVPIRPRGSRRDKDDAAAPASADEPRRSKGGEKRKDKDKDDDEEEEATRAGSEEGCVERMHLRPRASGGGANGLRKKKKVEMWISLSRDEIEEDYYSITGCKLPRRPKRRPRTAVHPTVLNRIFPGSWLPNTVTLEMYRVHEPADQRKR